ncbi:MAG: hypothetical protein B9J98_05960 [Candidatus Terraquivivens tikiterensis]|uniref:HEPN domain-containing protein n=1 Tax=Candidatus Terraquivivens tikiterensis TaxID=1980982 RepID=A0A2R7Y1S2_9ARCH|nr:MAG: hypothetical protein B9J98_05960 [Candidatus Terraquivivens tikiterensis]
MRMAKETIKSAKGDLERKDYSWACFKAQQSGEFAIKALLRGLEAYGHSSSKLLLKISEKLDTLSIMDEAKTLDKYYTNGCPEKPRALALG